MNLKENKFVNLVEVIQSVDDQFCGLLIDCLSILDPEMLEVNPVLQRQFLFSKRNEVTSDVLGDRSSTAYMTSILVHQTQNSTLEDCFVWVLDHLKNTET